MSKFKYEECRRCVNHEFDPFQCEDCDKASNFEAKEPDDEDFYQEMSISEFAEVWKIEYDN